MVYFRKREKYIFTHYISNIHFTNRIEIVPIVTEKFKFSSHVLIPILNTTCCVYNIHYTTQYSRLNTYLRTYNYIDNVNLK